jgi:hypothetical protein
MVRLALLISTVAVLSALGCTRLEGFNASTGASGSGSSSGDGDDPGSCSGYGPKCPCPPAFYEACAGTSSGSLVVPTGPGPTGDSSSDANVGDGTDASTPVDSSDEAPDVTEESTGAALNEPDAQNEDAATDAAPDTGTADATGE